MDQQVSRLAAHTRQDGSNAAVPAVMRVDLVALCESEVVEFAHDNLDSTETTPGVPSAKATSDWA